MNPARALAEHIIVQYSVAQAGLYHRTLGCDCFAGCLRSIPSWSAAAAAGSRLLSESLAFCADDLAVKQALLHVHAGNEEALEFYTKRGFTVSQTSCNLEARRAKGSCCIPYAHDCCDCCCASQSVRVLQHQAGVLQSHSQL